MMCTRIVCGAAVLTLMFSTLAAADTLQDQLNRQYRNNVYMLRHFYRSNKLHYAGDGTLIGNSAEGPWTLGRFEVEKIKLGSGSLRLEGRRVATYFDNTPKQRLMAVGPLEIQIDLPAGNPTLEGLTAMLHKIFIFDTADLAGSVPAYWCTFFKTFPQFPNLVPTNNAQPLTGCGIGSPHVNSPVAAPKKTTSVRDAGLIADGILKVGGGVSAPGIISVPDPDYEPLAKAAKFQGTSVLWLVVDEQGMPQNIQVARALGMGLDERAVQAVSRWRFKPSMRDGQPVAVQINVEVNFRLY